MESVLRQASVKHSEGKYSETIKDLKEIHNLRPYHDRISLHYAIALLFQEKKISEEDYRQDCKSALKVLLAAIHQNEAEELNGNHERMALMHYYAGMAYWFSDQIDHALFEFKISLRLNPDLKEAEYNQAAILAEQ